MPRTLEQRRVLVLIAALFALTVSLAAASNALATTRYAVPGGNTTDPNCQSPAANCSIQRAADVASTGDELIVMPGTYDFGTSAGPTIGTPLEIHGQDGQPRPLLISDSGSSDWTFLDIGLGGTRIRHLAFEQDGTGAALLVAGDTPTPGVQVEDVTAVARGAGAVALQAIGDETLLRDSTAFATGAGGAAIRAGSTLDAINVTAVAIGASGIGWDQTCQNTFLVGCTGDSESFLFNTIARGGTSGSSADLKAHTGNCDSTCVTYHTTIDAQSSNYENVTSCTGCSITPASDNQIAAPQFVDKANGDFHELVTSPTRDTGGPGTFLGPSDPDGNPRTLGPAPDIGAFEYNGMPLATTLGATGVGSNSATLNASVDARGLPTSFFFQWGTSTTYGNQAPPAAANAGSAVGAHPVAATATGLPSGTTIHYRVVASSTYGTVFGADQSFTTGAGGKLRFAGALRSTGNGVSFKLRCTGGTCRGKAVLSAKERLRGSKIVGLAKTKTVTVGSKRFTIANGKTQTIKPKLNATGRKLLKKFKKLPVRLKVTLNVPGGKPVVVKTAKTTIKPKARRHKKH
jgi:hypothetical protein